MTLRFREITTADLAVVLALRFSTLENAITAEELERDYGITEASLAEDMKTKVKGWLCEADGKVVGFSVGDRSNGEVQVVAVLPGFQGRGVGKGCLDRVQAWLYGCGHEEIWLRANPDPRVRATGFYRKLGWEQSGRMQGGDEILTRRKTATVR